MYTASYPNNEKYELYFMAHSIKINNSDDSLGNSELLMTVQVTFLSVYF